jgi:hypothetical protein
VVCLAPLVGRSTDPRVAADGAVAATLLTVARRARMVEDAVMRIETACYLDGIERWLTQPAATSDGRS